MPTLFIVTEEGTYRHRILGIYHRFADAYKRAHEEAEASDGHHAYDVNQAQVDADMDDVRLVVRLRRPHSGFGMQKVYGPIKATWASQTLQDQFEKLIPKAA